MIPSFVFTFVFFLIFCIVMATKIYPRWQAATNDLPKKIAIGVEAVCIFAFCEAFWINFFPPKILEHVELPNSLGADRLTAPDGRVFIVSSPIMRVQRYGPDGFEMGFMYGRKAIEFGMSPSGNILICTYAGGELLTYSPDGVEVPPRGLCQPGFAASSPLYPSRAKVPTIAFNWLSAVAVPLWHPVAAWLIALLAGLFCFALSED